MPVIPRESDIPAVTDKEVFQECAHRLKVAIEAEGDNRKHGEMALEFRDGHQWPDDLYNQRKIDKRPSLTINHTNTFCRRVVNNMRQQRPRIKVHPVGNGADQEVADVIGGLIRHIENRSNASVAYDTAGESAVNIGWGYFRILTEYMDERSFDQEIKIAPIRNVFTCYIDPSAQLPDGSDMDWFIITHKMKRQDYKREYPDAQNIEFRRTDISDGEWESKDEIRLAEYFRVSKVKDTLYRMTNGDSLFEQDMRILKADLEAAKVTKAKGPNGYITRESFRRQIEWFQLNGETVIDKRILPGRWIPIVRCEGNVLELNGQVRRKGMIWDLMDVARMYNYWVTKQTEVMALTPLAPWVGAAGQFDGHDEWQDANQRPYNHLEYEPTYIEQPDGSRTPMPPPQRTPPVPVQEGFVNAAMGAKQDLMAIAGMPHEPAQDTPGTVVSGIAIQRRNALSDIGHFQYYDNQTLAIAQCGRICLDWIPVYYSTARMQRIIGEDGVPNMVQVNQPQPNPENPAIAKVKNDLTVGRYDVVMDTGPGYETKRIEGADAMLDLLKTPLAEPIAKLGADLVVRNMDFAGSGDLADRLMPMTPEGMQKVIEKLPKDAKGIVTAMQQQMQGLQQELQKAQLEIKYKTTVEKGWMDVEREKAKESNTTKQIDTHVKSVTARDVAEIKAGATLLNTHVEAAHNRVAAHEALAAAENAEKAPIQ